MKSLLLLTMMLWLGTTFASPVSRFLITQLQTNPSVDVQSTSALALQQFTDRPETIQALTDVLINTRFAPEVKAVAIKALAMEARNARTSRLFLETYQRESHVPLKATILRSLWAAAEVNHQVKEFLEQALIRENEVMLQEAAAFGLLAVNHNRTYGLLIDVVNSPRYAESVKVEALKSLFWNRSSQFKMYLESMVRDQRRSVDVRVAGLKLLQQAFVQSNQGGEFLTSISTSDPHQEVRLAALDALRPRFEERDVRWFRLHRHPVHNVSLNPLD